MVSTYEDYDENLFLVSVHLKGCSKLCFHMLQDFLQKLQWQNIQTNFFWPNAAVLLKGWTEVSAKFSNRIKSGSFGTPLSCCLTCKLAPKWDDALLSPKRPWWENIVKSFDNRTFDYRFAKVYDYIITFYCLQNYLSCFTKRGCHISIYCRSW